MELEELKVLLNSDDRFCRYNGIQLDVIKEGYAEAVMPITENSLNGLNIAQGGAIFTLADLAFAGAANSHGYRTVGLNSNINYIRPGVGKELRAKATEVSHGRRTCVYRIEVFNDEGKLVAHGSSTGFITEQKF
ncbi:MAG: PaaI family thioesterase [Victivallales bacterium]|jgi:acyl-CoA thioesterase|nr:PaaI family thioesterase [Victivallales bacterium]